MPLVTFTDVIQRHVSCPPTRVQATTIREALDEVFAVNPRARPYVLDDRGALRHHMAVFIGGRQVRDRMALSDPVDPDAEVYVMQALSGG